MNVIDSFRLDGKVAVVTGGGRGLGAAGAQALAGAGATVLIVGRTEDDLAHVAGSIRAQGGRAHFKVLDVSQPDQVGAVFAELSSEHETFDILVNNAGTAHQAAAANVELDDWDRVVDVNLRGMFVCVREFVRQFHSGAERVIVNFTSVAASVGVKGQSAYAASKGGVESLTRALAIELARDGIRVNAISPGYFRTEMPSEVLADQRALDALLRRVPQHRIADPCEIGPPLVFLASAASRFMTGSTLHFDGGYTAQ